VMKGGGEELNVGFTNLDPDKGINGSWLAIKDQLKNGFEIN